MDKRVLKKIIIVTIVFAIVLVRCKMDDERSPIRLSDQRFNGEFYTDVSYHHYDDDSYILPYTILVFDGTSKAKMNRTPIEIQVSNGKWRFRDWNDKAKDETKWTQWLNYRFSDDGTVLTCYGWFITTTLHSDGTTTRDEYYLDERLIKK